MFKLSNILNKLRFATKVVEPACAGRYYLNNNILNCKLELFGYISRKKKIALSIAGILLTCVLSLLVYLGLKEYNRSHTIVIYGDTRTGHEIHQKITDLILRQNPALVFHTGDLVADGRNEADWRQFDAITSKLLSKVKFYPVLGNHERESNLYFEKFDLPNNKKWYTVDYQKIHFIMLDSNEDLGIDSPQYQWLKSDLQETKETKFIIVVMHHPLFSSGPHAGEKDSFKDSLLPLFKEYQVNAVFSGHDHFYERSFYDGIYYIISGGGGAPLYDMKTLSPNSEKFAKSYNFCLLKLREDKIVVEVIDNTSKVIDSFEINSRL